MQFFEADKYLLSLGNEVEAMKLGLENIRTLLTALGDPQNKYLKVQVAGTNGKGSVCAFLNSICQEARIKTGLYTSPHLISITERIRINGVDISEDEFARISTYVRETAERLLREGALAYRPTFFEQVTAIALAAFAEAGVEVAILETGLGGRLDATTAADAEIAAITRIDLDHQEYLGETIEEIAAEKAAIIHTGSKAVVGKQRPDVMGVILDRCAEFGVEPLLSETHSLPVVFPPLGLAGRHQIENAEVAFMLAELLQKHFSITAGHIASGLSKARHPGRLEYQGRYLFDGAHNIGGANALAAYVGEFETRPITMIFGAMRDKDISEIAKILFPIAGNIILTRPNNSRAMTADEIAEFIPAEFDRARCFMTPSVDAALAKAVEIAGAESIILITGSLYLVGEAKRILNN